MAANLFFIIDDRQLFQALFLFEEKCYAHCRHKCEQSKQHNAVIAGIGYARLVGIVGIIGIVGIDGLGSCCRDLNSCLFVVASLAFLVL